MKRDGETDGESVTTAGTRGWGNRSRAREEGSEREEREQIKRSMLL